jgi:hypothetical protein
VIARVRLDGVRFLLQVVRPYCPEFGLHRLDITGHRGFAVEVVEAAQERQRAVFHGAWMPMILEQDGLQQPYQEQLAAFHQYYQAVVRLRIAPVQLLQYGL